MIKNILLIASICVCIGVMAGCSTRIGDFTVMSSKNIYCENVDITQLPQKRVEGKDVTFLGIGANLKDALDVALEAGDGNMMIDAAIYIESAPFMSGYKIEGTVVKVPYKK